MPSLLAKAGSFERSIAVTSLGDLVTVLAPVLGPATAGGAVLERLFAETIEAECVICGIRLVGTDLIAASLGSDAPTAGSSLELARLRLGYCARKTCKSSYYVVRFAPWPNIDWREVWIHIQPALAAVSTASTEPAPPVRWRSLIPERWLQRASKPVPILIASALVLVLCWRGGCRVPGLSPKPRVFIVPESSATPPANPEPGR